MGKVCVIIPNYNYGRFVRRAVESALMQTQRPAEVIVVDDGSTDDSRSVLDSFGDLITVIEQSNQGVAAARNKGCDAASGEYVAFLDADDYWHPEKLEKQIEKFRSDTEIGFVHCGVTNVDEDGKRLDDYITGDEGWVANALLKFEPVVIANTIVVRRDVFDRIGGYDTTRELHPSEDWDLCYRLSRECKLGFVREPLHYYRQHGQGGHTNIERMERAMLMAYEKAFNDPDQDVQRLRNEAYGNLYAVLAGSYYHAGRAGKGIVCAAKGLFYNPSTAGRIFGFPFRAAGKTLRGRPN